MASTAAPDGSPVQAAADNFINHHTELLTANDLPIPAECPVCLEHYTTEPAARIINVQGCNNHVIGLNCLISLLTSHPNQDKKCPLCRTTWIEAPIRAIRVDQNSLLQGSRATFLPLSGGSRSGRRATGRTAQGQDNGDAIRRGRPREVVISLDSDSDEEVTIESFHQYQTAIADIRSRARNTQVSRRRQRQEARNRNVSDNSSRRANNSGDTGRFIMRHLGMRGPVLSSSDDDGAFLPSRRRDFGTSFNSRNPFRTRAGHRNRDVGLHDSEVEVEALAGNAGAINPSSNERAQRLDQREHEMNERERRLMEREREAVQRERDIDQKDQRANQTLQMVQRQRREMEALVRKHREEMTRA